MATGRPTSKLALSRNQTIYIKDVIPQTLKDALKDPEYDLDKLLLNQIKVLSSSKKALLQERSALLTAIHEKCEETSNTSCGPFGKDFLTLLLKDIQEDEADLRRKVLGEQESVEMFKQAFADEKVSEHSLTTARAYRDAMTMRLADVVEQREIVFIALEVLQRSPLALIPQNEPEMAAVGLSYSETFERHLKECEILKKLTEWNKKPELHITEEDELFSFFSDEVPQSLLNSSSQDDNNVEAPNLEKQEENIETSELASALAPYESETDKLVQFKKTKVESVDNEFAVLCDLATDVLKYEKQMVDNIALIQKAHGCVSSSDSYGIEQYLSSLKTRHPTLKFKISTKGYNFSLKVIHRTKSVLSLDLLSTLLSANQELPDEIKDAQTIIHNLCVAVKRICSKFGRCSMTFQSVMKREKELETVINESPKVDYAESLRITSNFTANMKEVQRVNILKDQVKAMADNILREVMSISSAK